jgi:hypothetical protein
MFSLLKKLWPFKKKRFSDEQYEKHYELKKKAMEKILGPMYKLVGHALIPFQIGGAVDMYYFTSCMPGTVFATMELIEPDGSGPKPNRKGTYEIITCTKLTMPPLEPHEVRKKRIEEGRLSDFDKIECRMTGIMTRVGNYSFDAVLNPGETAEIPWEDDEVNCLVFDEFDTKGISFEIEGKKHCLLLCIEIFRSEMEYAKQFGSKLLLAKLKDSGFYPYSDLDRKPVA